MARPAPVGRLVRTSGGSDGVVLCPVSLLVRGAWVDGGGVSYASFIASKQRIIPAAGFDRYEWTAPLFPFQQAVVEWALRQGRAAIFADTGLGKTAMQLEWAHQVGMHTGRPVLIIAPLGVTAQTVEEARKFDIPCVRVIRTDADIRDGINVINFDMALKLDWSVFGGVVLDESSILKNAIGRTRSGLVAAAQQVPYRLACTATPAPNDHTELGNHAEFLGVMEHRVMLAMFFINDLSATIEPWRLKGHAEEDFWRWVASWARCVTKPSDVGPFDDAAYILPPLHLHRVDVEVDIVADAGGALFRNATVSATALHAERRRTTTARVTALAAHIAAEPDEAWLIWCETDYEAEAVRAAVPDLVEVHGSDKPEVKADRLIGFAHGQFKRLLTKPKIAGFGMNWQHCARMAMVGVSYEWESFYQRIRRCWRFGQSRPVHVYCAVARTEAAVWASIERKAANNDDLRSAMLVASRKACNVLDQQTPYIPTHDAPIPAWFRSLS